MSPDERRDQADRDRIVTGTMFNMDWGWTQRVALRTDIQMKMGGATPGHCALDDDDEALAALAAGDVWRVPASVLVGCDCGCPARAAWRAHGLYFCAHHARHHGITQD